MFGGGEDFVEVNGNTERDEEESPNSRADPVWGLERWWSYELGPERGASGGEEYGILGREGWED